MAAVVASKAQLSALEELMPTDDDLLYEEELLRNPYSLKMWWRYIQARTDASARRRYVLYERALKALPGSYKVGTLLRGVGVCPMGPQPGGWRSPDCKTPPEAHA
jgi:hypothetical protein